jgi:hypothetical protein
MSEELYFPTPLHAIAYKYYNHYPEATANAVNEILLSLDDRKLGILKNIYSEGTQFTRHQKISAKWREWYSDPDDHLSGSQVDMLIFLLNMYACDLAKIKRKRDLAKGRT